MRFLLSALWGKAESSVIAWIYSIRSGRFIHFVPASISILLLKGLMLPSIWQCKFIYLRSICYYKVLPSWCFDAIGSFGYLP
ncbi:hypothetical protein V8C37DRAFT_215534 [Trichoderma ceciliae]